MRKLLITNDDGITFDGLIRLARTAREFGEVYVIAPDGQRSAASHSITLRSPIDIFPAPFPVEGVRAFACSGTPCDCVRVCRNVMPAPPDAVLSGINYGYNAATDIQYSATVGAAFEAAFQGYHAIALSEEAVSRHDVTDAYLRDVLAELLEAPLDRRRIHNVNFPGCAVSECRGILRDRTVSGGMFFRDEYREISALPGGGLRVLVNGIPSRENEDGTDFRALTENYISVSVVTNIG